MLANPLLADLLDDTIGTAWRQDSRKLSKLNALLDDSTFLDELEKVKHQNKLDFAAYHQDVFQHKLDPDSIFDFQAKRFHEYKRQLLNALHIIHLVLRIKDGETAGLVPHSFFFAGKAAPGYYMAKLVIRLICAIGTYIDRDRDLSKYLKVVFLHNYRVTLAERIMPAAEVSQQISTAGTEASGTGNMKFAINGALTVGTLDGANIEIRDAVGSDNFFLFGMTAEQVKQLKQTGYHPYGIAHGDPTIKRIIDFIGSGELDAFHPGLFQPILNSLLYQGDEYCVIADLADYTRVMEAVNDAYPQRRQWNRMSAANIANMGLFSSDVTIEAYAREIWGVIK